MRVVLGVARPRGTARRSPRGRRPGRSPGTPRPARARARRTPAATSSGGARCRSSRRAARATSMPIPASVSVSDGTSRSLGEAGVERGRAEEGGQVASAAARSKPKPELRSQLRLHTGPGSSPAVALEERLGLLARARPGPIAEAPRTWRAWTATRARAASSWERSSSSRESGFSCSCQQRRCAGLPAPRGGPGRARWPEHGGRAVGDAPRRPTRARAHASPPGQLGHALLGLPADQAMDRELEQRRGRACLAQRVDRLASEQRRRDGRRSARSRTRPADPSSAGSTRDRSRTGTPRPPRDRRRDPWARSLRA